MGLIKTTIFVLVVLIGVFVSIQFMGDTLLSEEFLNEEFSPLKKLTDITEVSEEISPGIKENTEKFRDIGIDVKDCLSNYSIGSDGTIELCPKQLED